jgi:hypothetical protein
MIHNSAIFVFEGDPGYYVYTNKHRRGVVVRHGPYRWYWLAWLVSLIA